jgi:hypothetical protein
VHVHRTSDDDRTRGLATALAASVSSGYVSLSFFDAFAFPMTMGTLFLLIGLSGALRDHTLRSASRESPGQSPASAFPGRE